MPKLLTRQDNCIEDLLQGKGSNAIASFFCGEYFCKTVTAHPRFSELQELFWTIETRLYSKLSKKVKARRSLNLTSHVSDFFGNPDIEINPVLLSIQQEILGDWAKVHYYFGAGLNS